MSMSVFVGVSEASVELHAATSPKVSDKQTEIASFPKYGVQNFLRLCLVTSDRSTTSRALDGTLTGEVGDNSQNWGFVYSGEKLSIRAYS